MYLRFWTTGRHMFERRFVNDRTALGLVIYRQHLYSSMGRRGSRFSQSF